ncbi:MAG: hypothetical protein GYB68_12765 [Chloroflexi bacterium]|nr:hypothetical protein [Chloroflexota bacterium]
MPRHFREHTLHTGEIAYLKAPGLVQVPFPVLVEPTDSRYDAVVARSPAEDDGLLFYSIWEPTRTMQLAANDVFGDMYRGQPEPIEDDATVWTAVTRVYRMLSIAPPDAKQHGAVFMRRAALSIGRAKNLTIPPVALVATSEFYEAWGALVFPNHLAASIGGASLLLMLGVPRERIAVFGVYYQDPTVYFEPSSDWRGGFMSGTPYYTVLGIFVNGEWVLVDYTVQTDAQMANTPRHHLRNPVLGNHPEDGALMVIDYPHPYTMIFAPEGPDSQVNSPLLSRIPLIQVQGWKNLVARLNGHS